MAKDLFKSEASQTREVLIPAEFKPDVRGKFIAAITSACEKQTRLADLCEGAVRVESVEQLDDRLVIHHERIRPLDPTAVVNSRRKPDVNELWWFAWIVERTLAAADKQKLVHGGLHLGSLGIDDFGRLKLTDFGIAPAFEAALRTGTPKNLYCDLSGATPRWSIPRDEPNALGWISPYYARELLAPGAALTTASDLFAAGMILYALATGAADGPYGQIFEEPQTAFPVRTKPAPCATLRTEWKAAVAEAAKGMTKSADAPLVDWIGFIENGLLASGTKERTGSLAEFTAAAGKYAGSRWDAVLTNLAKARDAFLAGDATTSSAAMQAAAGGADLPALWKQQIAAAQAWLAPAVKRAGAESWLKKRQHEIAFEADSAELDKWLTEAAKLAKDHGDDAPLVTALNEFAAKIEGRKTELAAQDKAYLRAMIESASQEIAEGKFDNGRTLLQGVVGDPNANDPLRAEARDKLAQLDRVEKAASLGQKSLDRARKLALDLAFDDARAALVELETLADLDPRLLRPSLAEVTAEIDRLAAEFTRWNGAIDAVDVALAALKVADAEKALAGLSKTPPHARLEESRQSRAARLNTLRDSLARLDAIEKLIAQKKDADARRELQALIALPGVPEPLAERARARHEQLRLEAAAREKAARETAQRAFDALDPLWNDAAFDALLRDAAANIDTFRAFLEAEKVKLVEQRVALCTKLRDGLKSADADAEAGKFEHAAKTLDQLAALQLPAKAAAQIEDRRAKWAASVADRRERMLALFRQRIAQAGQKLDQFKIAEAAKLLDDVEAPAAATDADRQALAAMESRLESLKSAEKRIAEIDSALESLPQSADAKPFAVARGAIDAARRTPDLPAAAIDQLDRAAKRVDAAESAWRQAREKQFQGLLSAAEESLKQDDVEKSRAALASAEKMLAEFPAAQPRVAQLSAALSELAEWKPKLERARAALAGGDLPTAIKAAADALASPKIPTRYRDALQQVRKDAEQKLAAQREALAKKLSSLQADFDAKAGAAPDVARRAAEIIADPLVTAEQRQAAEAIAAKHKSLRGAATMRIVGIAAAVIVVGGGAAAFFATRKPADDKKEPPPIVKDDSNKPKTNQDTTTDKKPETQSADTAQKPQTKPVVTDQTPTTKSTVAQKQPETQSTDVAQNGDQQNPTTSTTTDVTANTHTDNPDTTNTQQGDTSSKPVEEPPCTRLFASSPPQAPAVLPLAPLFEASAELKANVQALIDLEISPALKALPLNAATWNLDADGAAAHTTATLKIADDLTIALTGESKCDGQKFAPPTWSLAAQADAQAAVSAWATSQAKLHIERHQSKDQLAAMMALAAQFKLADAGLPPPWTAVDQAGTEAPGPLDKASGYPQMIRVKGRDYRLVIAAPDEAAWTHVASILPDVKPHWRVFYIENAESSALSDTAAAQSYASEHLAALPTREEWLLAAFTLIKQAPQMRLFGSPAPENLFEWCQDAPDGAGWALGGCSINEKYKSLKAPTGSESDLAAWLSRHEVMQQRTDGQGLVGARLVWRPQAKR